VLHPTMASWVEGCWGVETWPDNSHWRWCKDTAVVRFYNPGAGTRSVRMTARVATGSGERSDLLIQAPALSQTLSISGDLLPTAVDMPLTLRPGTTFVRFRFKGRRFLAPTDPRQLFFRVSDFDVSDAASPPAVVQWQSGCSLPTGDLVPGWRSCSGPATVAIDNKSSTNKSMAIAIAAEPAADARAEFQVTGPGLSTVVDAGPQPFSIGCVLSIPPGVSNIEVRPKGDPAHAAFRIVRFDAFDLSSFPVIYSN
jgi:hypothetical protein